MSEGEGQALQHFAELLMVSVRDRAVSACDQLASGSMAGPDGDRWRLRLPDENRREALRALIPDVIDQVLFELLNAVDNGELPLAWRSGDSVVDLKEVGAGEMAGWFMGSPGWRHQFSRERFFDPLSGLKLDLDPKPSDEG